jgi:hypothetical protein
MFNEDDDIYETDHMQDMSSIGHVTDLVESTKKYDLTTAQLSQGKAVCKTLIEAIAKLKLPKSVKDKPELVEILRMQVGFENFALQSMFIAVAKAVRMLEDEDFNDCLTPDGEFDPNKLLAIMNLQQHVMSMVMQFNTHVRRLPVVFSDMIRDLEYTQMQAIEVSEAGQEFVGTGANCTSTPLSLLLQETKRELDAKAVEVVEEPEKLDVSLVKEPAPDYSNEDSNIEL